MAQIARDGSRQPEDVVGALDHDRWSTAWVAPTADRRPIAYPTALGRRPRPIAGP